MLGADSQVALAVLVKGGSSSPSLNDLMRRSLPTVLGEGLYGSYGHVPSLANVADDPTRGAPLRKPQRMPVFDLKVSLEGRFHSLDCWLEQVGYSVEQITGLPTAAQDHLEVAKVGKQLLAPLRAVQKPERQRRFDEKLHAEVSPPVVEKVEEKPSRELKNEPDGRTKNENKRPKNFEERSFKAVSFVSKQVAPPAVTNSRTSPAGLPWGARTPASHGSGEDERLPLLSAEAADVLSKIPKVQFILPGGRRAGKDFVPQRQGYLDLYSGKAGVAKSLAQRFGTWVITFDFCHEEGQDLLLPEVQQVVFDLIQSGAVWGVGAAPECCSFSRAVCPEGLPGLSARMQEKVSRGNCHAAFVLKVLLLAVDLDLAYWLENPDGSFLWLQPAWLASGIARFDRCYRFDMCRYGTRWRKRTRVLTNTHLQGVRELCGGGHSHLPLRGRSLQHQQNWTRVAQVYPAKLCRRLASALAARQNLCGVALRSKLDMPGCARCGHSRIGEAQNPGPARRRAAQSRNADELLAAPMLEPATLLIQRRAWEHFDAWLTQHVSGETREQVFLCPSLAAHVLRTYGFEFYEKGGPLYELRHLLVYVQRYYPILKAVLGPAWDVVSRWEEVRPVQHRIPLPEILFRALFAAAMFKGWRRWAATLLLSFEGIGRIGGVLAACRRDLVLPSDMFDSDHQAVFLRVRKPKSKRRGKGRIQHLKVDRPEVVQFLDAVFSPLDSFLPLFPLSASVFRTRWEKLLTFLGIPKVFRPTPASVRGGGAIAAYRRGEPIQSILWRMRLVCQSTLESYLQELAAESFLIQLPQTTKDLIRFVSSLFPYALASPG